MNRRAKVFIENQKKETEEKLQARIRVLDEKGMAASAIAREATVRRLKARIRQADFRLASIAAQYRLDEDKVRAKEERMAAEKAAREKPPEAPAAKKPPKEKKEKKEKAAGPDKAGKKAKPPKKEPVPAAPEGQ